MRTAAWIVLLAVSVRAGPADGDAGSAPAARPAFRAGAAVVDITPPAGLPMWGYGGRKDLPADGVLDPLHAAAVVIEVGEERLALVGLDLGRSPARGSLGRIREKVRSEGGVSHVMLVGSHTHHGPCVELEKVEPTAGYVRELEEKIAAVVLQARQAARPARIAAGSAQVMRNRNRHTKLEPKPADRTLTVLRLDGDDGAPIATVVNFAAHPTTLPALTLKYSADFPGPMRARVEQALGGVCVFLQGAAGDLSTDRRGLDTAAFGEALGDEVVELARSLVPASPASPSLSVREEEFRFASRIDLDDPLTYLKYCAAFFKDLVDAYREEYREGVRPQLTVAVLNGDIGIAGCSGEFFASHALRLRERARIPHLLFLGYCNGYHQYFPTIEATAEGGYGADPEVSPVEIGAGERMMDRALQLLYELRPKMRRDG